MPSLHAVRRHHKNDVCATQEQTWKGKVRATSERDSSLRSE